MDAELLKRVRGTIKSKLTRAEHFIKGLDLDGKISTEQLDRRLIELNKIFDAFEEVQCQLETLAIEKDDDEQREAFEAQFYETECLFQTAKKRAEPPSPPSSIEANPPSLRYGIQPFQLQSTAPEVKLPPVNLPTFDGTIESYLPFKELFKAMVESTPNLSKTTMFYYLKSALSHEASSVIQSIPATSSNYELAWELLDGRYECPGTIIENLNLSILNLTPVTIESAAALRRLLDAAVKNVRALRSLSALANDKDSLLVTILLQKLDCETRKQFKLSLTSVRHIPTFDELQQFLERRIQALESLVPVKKDLRSTRVHITHTNEASPQPSRSFPSQSLNPSNSFKSQPSKNSSCSLCQNYHFIAHCSRFKCLTTSQKYDVVKKAGLCFNCLGSGHRLSSCNSSYRCRHCDALHHSLLHSDTTVLPGSSNSTSINPAPPTVSLFGRQTHTSTQILLSTAAVLISDSTGHQHTCRALLDCGSQSNFITKQFATRLSLPLFSSQLQINGICNSKSTATCRVMTSIQSMSTRYRRQIELFVLPKITGSLPTSIIDTASWNIPKGITLADPEFNIPGEVDILLGAQLFLELLRNDCFPATNYRPALRNTQLGWVFGGPIPTTSPTSTSMVTLSLAERVERFWSLEDCPQASKLSKEEQLCERHFQETHLRNENGQYVVRLPYQKNPNLLGHSRQQARRRWLAMETRLSKDQQLKIEYHKFLQEYVDLGHMTLLGPEHAILETKQQYYIPHHAVKKELSTTTKVRIVFDASAKTSTGTSLNNILMVGPTVQDTLFSILVRFRKHQYAIMADINKMYRQVLVSECDQRHQLILWRKDPSLDIQVYKLNTVTYGTAPAPFLATRALNQLAIDEGDNFPLAAAATSDIYVDDVITGSDSIDIALQLQQELLTVLRLGGFHLRKWAANDPRLLSAIPPQDQESLHELQLLNGQAVKALGLIWVPSTDNFHYDASAISQTPAITKRQVLSQIASLFDPLGLLGPVLSHAKIFMQQLWQLKVQWDDELPSQYCQSWATFNQSIKELKLLQVPRYLGYSTTVNKIELHGFADASEQAYGCCVYLRTITTGNEVHVNLVCAKSRVAPQKQLTLPRLELCAALLLCKLLKTCTDALKIPNLKQFAWSDSMTTLAWIKAAPQTWKTFVANRVAQIQHHTLHWQHVSSENNPADLISRGCSVNQLQQSTLWWHGPRFLTTCDNIEQTVPHISCDMPEKRTPKVISLPATPASNAWLQQHSCLWKLLKVTAWMLRFYHNTTKPDKLRGRLSIIEIDQAQLRLVRLAQEEEFHNDLNKLKTKGHVSMQSSLRQLNPSLHSDGLLHVSGRLQQSNLTSNARCPIILPPKHHITKLIVNQEHLRSLHGGPLLTLSNLRQRWWIVNGRNVVRRVIHQCITCFRAHPINSIPLMGQLPAVRTSVSTAFRNTGIDFAGPILIKPPTRSNIKLKTYIALFVCMATRAIHLELVGSLSTDSFIAALKRFISRRGLCTNLYCDNATNFVGAKNQLQEVYAMLRNNQTQVASTISQLKIQWHFIPPGASNFGGLWEAGVKSVKYHLKRVCGTTLFTAEEMSTVLTVIEACLNSRPLTPLSSDPTDLQPLTPGHFLIGRPLLAIPESDFTNTPGNRLTKWNQISAATQQFWKRWSKEYISSLNTRTKWHKNSTPLVVGQLSVIKEDGIAPLQWRLGRIEHIHPGQDGIVRVVSIRTKGGTIRRPATKIFPLPIEDTSK